jgi:hypothetical protein
MGDSSRGYLTTSTLIEQVKIESMMPSSQAALSDDDLLRMANQEIRVGMLPTIMQFHEEFGVYTDAPYPIIANQSAYQVPYRAVGGKVRTVFYLDESNNFCRLTRVDPPQIPYFQQSSVQNNYVTFFMEGDFVVLLPGVNSNPTGSLVMSYYMRPNELVDESRVATIKSVSNTNSQGTITGISVAAAAVITSQDPHGLTSGNIVLINQTNSTPAISGFYPVTVLSSTTFSVPVTTTGSGTTGEWIYNNTTYSVDQIPQNVTPFTQNGATVTGFSTSALLDVLRRNPGHHTFAYDVNPLAVDTVNKTITFYTPDIVTFSFSPNVIPAPVPGDYIAFAGEAIIPQIPSDLHDVLSQRVVCRVLQSLGDAQGYQIAKDKLDEMNKLMGNLIDNRTESQNKKIVNLSGTLRAAKAWNRSRFY